MGRGKDSFTSSRDLTTAYSSKTQAFSSQSFVPIDILAIMAQDLRSQEIKNPIDVAEVSATWSYDIGAK